MSCYYSNITYRNSKYILFLSIPSTTSVFSSAFVISSEFCCLYCGCLAYLLASPFPLKEFFVFCPIPIFCSKIFSLFHNLFFLTATIHYIHMQAQRKNSTILLNALIIIFSLVQYISADTKFASTKNWFYFT